MIAYQKSPGRAVTLIVQRHRTGTNESAKDEPTKKNLSTNQPFRQSHNVQHYFQPISVPDFENY